MTDDPWPSLHQSGIRLLGSRIAISSTVAPFNVRSRTGSTLLDQRDKEFLPHATGGRPESTLEKHVSAVFRPVVPRFWTNSEKSRWPHWGAVTGPNSMTNRSQAPRSREDDSFLANNACFFGHSGTNERHHGAAHELRALDSALVGCPNTPDRIARPQSTPPRLRSTASAGQSEAFSQLVHAKGAQSQAGELVLSQSPSGQILWPTIPDTTGLAPRTPFPATTQSEYGPHEDRQTGLIGLSRFRHHLTRS